MYDELHLPQDHYQAGYIIGQRSRQIMHEYILTSKTWQSLNAWIGSERLNRLENAARSTFADYMGELDGIADGCEIPFDQAFLWNCRGDLAPFISDGCTTVWAPSADGILLGHNEDGDPNLRPHCFISNREPGIDRPGYTAFTYPASINGHTFSVNSAGLVQLVNNIRSLEYGDGVPRQLLSRAILDCRSLDEAVAILKACQRAGSFHHMLAQAGEREVISIEYTPEEVSVLWLHTAYGHSNHFIHPRLLNAKQRITSSSASRQIRIDNLRRQLSGTPELEDIRRMLGDIDNPELPIYRVDPDDPDNENTLATALFRVTSDAVQSIVYIDGGLEQSFTTNKSYLNPESRNLKGGK